MGDLQLWFAIILGIVGLLVSFYVGYGTGQGDPAKSQLGRWAPRSAIPPRP